MLFAYFFFFIFPAGTLIPLIKKYENIFVLQISIASFLDYCCWCYFIFFLMFYSNYVKFIWKNLKHCHQINNFQNDFYFFFLQIFGFSFLFFFLYSKDLLNEIDTLDFSHFCLFFGFFYIIGSYITIICRRFVVHKKLNIFNFLWTTKYDS